MVSVVCSKFVGIEDASFAVGIMATQIFSIFTPNLGEDGTHFDEHIFADGLVQPPTSFLEPPTILPTGVIGLGFPCAMVGTPAGSASFTSL